MELEGGEDEYFIQQDGSLLLTGPKKRGLKGLSHES